jgi:hypothetical protein
MPAGSSRQSLFPRVQDPAIRSYLYLDLTLEELITHLTGLELGEVGDNRDVPFTASVRGYRGAVDTSGDSWLVKPIVAQELVDHLFQEAAYYIDFALGTVAAPNLVKTIGGESFRVTKNIRNALQISSYDYFNEPFKGALANDLINRWLFFDEDRNPNNYLVLHDSDRSPCVVVIDYNKADLRSTEMKITGNAEKFGWHRLEKTRFLTLLKPENFDNLSIEVFEDRLQALAGLTEELIGGIGRATFRAPDVPAGETAALADLLTSNILARGSYIEAYFRRWFKVRDERVQQAEDERYGGFGQSFLDYYKGKK